MTFPSFAQNDIIKTLRKGQPEPKLEQWTATLQQFLACARFDDAIVRANDSAYTRISIVMPAYNQVQFIERSILSVLNQNYPNLQFIIMDGGSTDGTLDVIRKYEKYLSWRSEPDHGQSDAINKALRLADGELVGWQNSDDVYFPGVFRRMDEFSRQRPRALIYSGTVVSIDPDDRIFYISKFIRPSMLRLLYEGFVMSSQGIFWRREVQARVGVYDPSLHHAMDMDFWLRVLAEGHAEFLPQLVGAFRIYEGTKTSVAGERGYVEARGIRMKYGVDDHTSRWKVARAGLRIARLLHWTFVTRPRCTMIAGRS
jgi:glycosyltransferase involved in cell wall biosynthesis